MASDPAPAVQALRARLRQVQTDILMLADDEHRSVCASLLAFAHEVAACLPTGVTPARRAMVRQWLLAAEVSLRDNDVSATLAAIGQAAITCEAALAGCPRPAHVKTVVRRVSL